MFHERALKLLRPAIGVSEVGLEFVNVEAEALFDGVVHAGFVTFEVTAFVPQFVELVVHARRRRDDAQL